MSGEVKCNCCEQRRSGSEKRKCPCCPVGWMFPMSGEVKVTPRAEEVAEEIVSAANIVTNGGYYEVDIDAVSVVVARFEAEVRQSATAETEALLKQAAGRLDALIALAVDGGLTHDLVAALYPGSKKPNGQPADDFAKRARQEANEARATLAAIRAKMGE